MKKRTNFTEGAIFQDNYGYAEIIKIYKPRTKEFKNIVSEYGLLTNSIVVYYKYSQTKDFNFSLGKWQELKKFRSAFKPL